MELSMRLVCRSLSILLYLALLTGCTKSPESPAGNGDSGAAPDTQNVFGESAGFSIDFEKYTLDNGLEVVLHTDHSDPVVAVASIFHVGSSREVPGRTGFAHFFEHMSFNDSENVPRGANRKYIEELGGSRNGGTWSDGTVYYEVVPTDALEKIFWIDSDRMGYMINTVTEEALEREKQVVKNEKRQRVDNAPYGHTGAVVRENLYPPEHPYSWTVIGSLDDLQQATLEDVKTFYERWYGANNATLVVAGDFDPEAIKPQIEQWFGEMRRGPEVAHMEPLPVTLEDTKKLWYPDNFARLPELRMVFPGVEQYHPDSYPLNVLGRVLAGTKRAPLYRLIVEERKLAPEVSASNSSDELAGEFSIVVRALEGTPLDEVEKAIAEGLARFEADGFPESELTRIKAELETGFYENLSGVLNKAFQLAAYNEYAGDPGYASEEIRLMQAVTREDVMRVYDRYIRGKPFLQTSFVPREAPELAVSGADLAAVVEEQIVQGAEAEVSQGAEASYEKTVSRHDRSEPPLGPPPVLRAPEIWTRSLSNGIEAIGIRDDEVPLVNFSLILPGGQWLDQPGKPGTASLLAALSMQGTAGRTPAELEEAIGLLGASITIEAGKEQILLSAVTLEREFENTVALVEEILLEPRWDETEFERLKREAEASIISAEGNPSTVSARAFYRTLYGADHPYGIPQAGTRESVASISLDDLKAWHETNVTPVGARLQLAGAVSGDRVAKAFSSLADKWQGEALNKPEYELAEPPAGQAVYFIDVPGSKQSVIRVGRRTLMIDQPDWARLNFANERLGGGSSARLTQLLRIEKGFTYGAYSRLGRFVEDLSPWQAGTSVRANVTLESLELIRQQISTYAATFTDEDTRITKNQIIKQNSRAFETLDAKLRLLNRIARQKLPHDIVEREQALLEAMSTADFQKIITSYLDEEEMIWVVVGDGATQRDRIAEFGYGKPVELDRQGRVVSAASE
jgi:zinc protease